RQRQYRQQLVGRPDTTSPGQREQQPAPGAEDPRQRFGNRQGYQQSDGQYGRQGRQQTEQRRPAGRHALVQGKGCLGQGGDLDPGLPQAAQHGRHHYRQQIEGDDAQYRYG